MASSNHGGVATTAPSAAQTPPKPQCSIPSDLIRPVEAARIIKVHPNTIRNWISQGVLSTYRLPSGHRRVKRSEILELAGYSEEPSGTAASRTIGYARISSRGPSKTVTSSDGEKCPNQLNNQIEDLRKFARDRFKIENLTVYKDIASGVNLSVKTRPSFGTVVRLITTGQIDRLLITHSDRLARLAYDLLEYLADLHEVKIIQTNRDPSLDADETAEDLKLMTDFIFTCIIKTYSKRNRQKLEVTLDDDTIERIQLMGASYGPTKIAQMLNAAGVKNSKGRKIHPYIVKKYLNPTYFVQNKNEKDAHIQEFIPKIEFDSVFLSFQQIYEQYQTYCRLQNLEPAPKIKLGKELKNSPLLIPKVRQPHGSAKGEKRIRGYIQAAET